MQVTWKRLGAGLGGALEGAVLGAVAGSVEAYVVLVACSEFLGFGDQDGLILLAVAPFGATHGAVIGSLRGLGVRNVLGWALGALVGLGLWAPLFLWGAHHQSKVISLVGLLMPLWCGGIGAALQGCRTRKKEHQLLESPAEVIREYEQWKQSETCPRPEERTLKQIAGNKCSVCERNIILSNEGKVCVHCGTVVHRACAPGIKCDVCEEPYQPFEPPIVDPLSEAILPPALRPVGSGGPAFAIILTTTLGILAILLWYLIDYSLAHSGGK